MINNYFNLAVATYFEYFPIILKYKKNKTAIKNDKAVKTYWFIYLFHSSYLKKLLKSNLKQSLQPSLSPYC